jgi:hypothetical protein
MSAFLLCEARHCVVALKQHSGSYVAKLVALACVGNGFFGIIDLDFFKVSRSSRKSLASQVAAVRVQKNFSFS